jgi:hypothetical protein
MINRTKMPRQLRNKGGITNVISRKKYGIGSDLKDFTRKIIPNEIADVAVKIAPVVAMIPGYGPAAAGIMRGIGRFDQRGSISDALKQGAVTYAGGKVFDAGMRGIGLRDKGASGISEFFNEGTRNKAGSLFKSQEAANTAKTTEDARKGVGIIQKATDATIGKVPLLNKLPDMVQQQLLVGGITSGASALYSYFTGEFEPQEPGETMGEYMARRNQRVKEQMRGYMDSYYTPLRNPQYAAMSDEEKNNFIDSIVGEQNDAMMATGGRVGYQVGGITMANTLAQNIARNRAAQAAFRQAINPSQQKVLQRLQANQPKSSPLETFAKHAMVSEAMKGKTGMDVIPEYALQTGADFQKKFSNVNPKVSAGLAAAYQTLQEGSRAILDGPGGVTLKDAYNTALDQTTKNIEGILAADSGNLTAKQIEDRNKYLKQQGQPTEEIPGAMNSLVNVNKQPTPDSEFENTMRKITADSEGFAAYAGIVPGFKARKRSDGRFEYKAPDGQIYGPDTYTDIAVGKYPDIYDPRANAASGGMPTGIMRSNKAGVMERDYRDEGGFVPVGIKEKADDVPAMLSKNEFVFTADAVRGAGNGSIEKGAQKMYDTMKNLERRVV